MYLIGLVGWMTTVRGCQPMDISRSNCAVCPHRHVSSVYVTSTNIWKSPPSSVFSGNAWAVTVRACGFVWLKCTVHAAPALADGSPVESTTISRPPASSVYPMPYFLAAAGASTRTASPAFSTSGGKISTGSAPATAIGNATARTNANLFMPPYLSALAGHHSLKPQ